MSPLQANVTSIKVLDTAADLNPPIKDYRGQPLRCTFAQDATGTLDIAIAQGDGYVPASFTTTSDVGTVSVTVTYQSDRDAGQETKIQTTIATMTFNPPIPSKQVLTFSLRLDQTLETGGLFLLDETGPAPDGGDGNMAFILVAEQDSSSKYLRMHWLWSESQFSPINTQDFDDVEFLPPVIAGLAEDGGGELGPMGFKLSSSKLFSNGAAPLSSGAAANEGSELRRG